MFCPPLDLERFYLRIIGIMKKEKKIGLLHLYLSKRKPLLKKHETFLEKCIDPFMLSMVYFYSSLMTYLKQRHSNTCDKQILKRC